MREGAKDESKVFGPSNHKHGGNTEVRKTERSGMRWENRNRSGFS